MGHKSYRKISRLGKEENKSLLENPCYVSYKLDGINAIIWCDEDKNFHTGSRTEEISSSKDNAGFAAWFEEEVEDEVLFIKDALRHYPELILFGEFLGVNKFVGNIKDYYKSALKTFWIFDVYDRKAQKYYTPLELMCFCEKHSLEAWLIPHFYLGDPSKNKIKEIAEKNSFLIATPGGKGEGVVIKSEDGTHCAKYILEVKKDKPVEDIKQKIEEACDFIVKTACLNTWTGNYLVSTEEVAVATHFTKQEIENEYWEEILYTLQCREEILDAEFDKENLLFDVICALDYCPNYQWVDGDEKIFNCSYYEWKAKRPKRVKSHGDLPYNQEKEN